MIDKDKIKSTAQGYCEATYGTLDDHPLIAEAFKKGANWAIQQFLKDLWHPNTEEPDKSKSDIITYGFNDKHAPFGFDDYAYLESKESILWNKESWKHSVSRCKITKWAYLSDILPEEGDNHD